MSRITARFNTHSVPLAWANKKPNQGPESYVTRCYCRVTAENYDVDDKAVVLLTKELGQPC